jgi:hypothetical protein
MGFPFKNDLERLELDIAILGLPYGDPYSGEEITNDQTNAPTAVRRASKRISDGLDRWDFDIGGPLSPVRIYASAISATCPTTSATHAATTAAPNPWRARSLRPALC